MTKTLAALGLLLLTVSTAMAGEQGTVRFGVSYQDFTSPEPGMALRGEVLLPKPDLLRETLPEWLRPSPLVGLSAYLGHGTSFLYAGALWTVPLTSSLFVEGSLSVAANNGASEPHQGRAALGCHGGFREEAGIGWRFDQSWSALVMVEHFSNANLCNHNRGLTNVGLMIGRSF